jgi:hypothetical protein
MEVWEYFILTPRCPRFSIVQCLLIPVLTKRQHGSVGIFYPNSTLPLMLKRAMFVNSGSDQTTTWKCGNILSWLHVVLDFQSWNVCRFRFSPSDDMEAWEYFILTPRCHWCSIVKCLLIPVLTKRRHGSVGIFYLDSTLSLMFRREMFVDSGSHQATTWKRGNILS